MVGIQDLIEHDVASLHEYFELIVCLYINNEPGERKKALKLYGLLDSEQKGDWNEFLKDGSFAYSLADEIEEFLEDNVKAYYIFTATNNAEYIAPPLNILAITLLTCTIISFIYLRKRIIKRYYHGSRTSNICRLIGIIESPGIEWRDKEGLLKDIVNKVGDRESLIYGD